MFNILVQWMHSVRNSVLVCILVWYVKAVIVPITGEIPKKKLANVTLHDQTATKIVQKQVWLYKKHFYHDMLILGTLCIY